MFKYHHRTRTYKISEAQTLKVPKKLLPFIDYLAKRTKEGVVNVKKLQLELRQRGCQGSYMTLYRFLRQDINNPQNIRRSLHFETGPGEQAQVDWGSLGEIKINGIAKRLCCFVYVLGYSRALYVEFTTRQNTQSLMQCHIHAFEQLGIPQTIVYDNMKTVVLRREKLTNGETKIHYNPAFLDFANFYGFKIFVCPPYWPQAKGKVEASVKYVKNNFFQGENFQKEFVSLNELNQKAYFWLSQVANLREHKTTGERPADRWLREKHYLRFTRNLPQYQVSHHVARNSTKDGLIQYRSNYYSVPMAFSRKKLYVTETQKDGLQFIEIYYQDKIIASHPLSTGRNEWIIDDQHILQKAPNIIRSKIKIYNPEDILKKYSTELITRPVSYYNQFIPKIENGKIK